MSLVAYGSSDESSDEEVKNDNSDEQNNITNKIVKSSNIVNNVVSKNPVIHMNLPVPKNRQISMELNEKNSLDGNEIIHDRMLGFGALPKPKNLRNDYECIPEDDDIPLFQPKQPVVDKPTKKEKLPAKIFIPSLSEFKDVDEDLEKSKNKPTASKKGTGLFSILPPPKNEIVTKKNNLIPHVLTKTVSNKTAPLTKAPIKSVPKSGNIDVNETKKILPVMDYNSNSEDDDEEGRDFFSLSKPTILPEIAETARPNFFSITENKEIEVREESSEEFVDDEKSTASVETTEISRNSTLVSTVMNMPREEIMLKNKAEVGPKLPVPEQDFNVDSEGNVAFDDKAIEYLCGKRGVKRKNQMIDEANIIEINGEDIKPDEREWLVKALTEEPVQRPVSMQGAGPSSQSKKKHQITYLAHQAKAMEVELKNTWSQNRMARKQTQSKYGF